MTIMIISTVVQVGKVFMYFVFCVVVVVRQVYRYASVVN